MADVATAMAERFDHGQPMDVRRRVRAGLDRGGHRVVDCGQALRGPARRTARARSRSGAPSSEPVEPVVTFPDTGSGAEPGARTAYWAGEPRQPRHTADHLTWSLGQYVWEFAYLPVC